MLGKQTLHFVGRYLFTFRGKLREIPNSNALQKYYSCLTNFVPIVDQIHYTLRAGHT
jgi:hypothetical protein